MAKTKKAAMAAMDAEWQAESDMHTLARAREIRNDPKRLKAAQELAKKKLMELAQVAGATADDDADD